MRRLLVCALVLVPAAAASAADVDGRQRQRHLHQPALLRRVLRPRPDPGRRRLLPHRHDDARDARAAGPALEGPGELDAAQLRARPARPRAGVPAGGRRADLRPGHLGAVLPLPRRHVLHLLQRQRPHDAALPRAQTRAGRGRAPPCGARSTTSPSSSTTTARSTSSGATSDIHFAAARQTRSPDIVPGSERIIIPADAGMGEGSHFYKIGGQVLHHQRVVRRADADAVRARRPAGRPVRGESRHQRRRGLRPDRGATGCARTRRRRSPVWPAGPAGARPRSRCTRAASWTRPRASGGASR